MTSQDFSRTELIGIIATLRGNLVDVIQNYKHRNLPTGSEEELKNAIEEAQHTIDKTFFDLHRQDEVDGGFDSKWQDKVNFFEE